MQRRGTQAFPGGVHPTDGSDKTLSMDQVVKPYRPDIVTILSEQTFGGTCQFTVKPGESVIEGQLIGKPNAFLAAPLHECEPFLTCDYRLMLEDTYALINGVRLLLKGSGAKKAYICLEDNKPQAAEHLTHILETSKANGQIPDNESIMITVLPAKYPQGGERQLIQSVLI